LGVLSKLTIGPIFANTIFYGQNFELGFSFIGSVINYYIVFMDYF